MQGVHKLAKQPSDSQQGERPPSSTVFSDLKKEIAERNERAHRDAQELRTARERDKLGIVSRHRLDLDR